MTRSVCIQEAADEMSVSMDTVRNLLDRGMLRGHRVGRALRVYHESLEDYQRRNEIEPKGAAPRRVRKKSPEHLQASDYLSKLGC